MARTVRRHVFFLDDEPKVCEVICETLEELDVKVSCFVKPADCLKRLRSKKCDLLITDVRMPEMDGIELLRQAKRLVPWVPVLLITGYGDVPMAVTALKAGAVDFIEKPLDRETFLRKVQSILQQNALADSYTGKPLTSNQQKVLKLVLEGRSNKDIANLLHRSVRTVEVHRAHVMRKLGVDNLVDLLKRATAMGLIEPPDAEQDQAAQDSQDHA